MALFPDPPELPVGYPERPQNVSNLDANNGLASSQQIFTYGSKVFVVGMADRDTGGSFILPYPIVIKRNGLASWSLPDIVHWQAIIDEPTFWTNLWQSPTVCQSGSTLHFFTGAPNPYPFLYQTFDMSSEVYSDPIQNPYNGAGGPGSGTQIAAFSGGSLIAAWGSHSPNSAGKAAIITSGGSVGAAVTWAAAAAGLATILVAMVVDSSDVAHIMYRKQIGAALDLYHVTVDSAGSVGTPDLVETISSFPYTMGPGVIFGGKLVFAGCRAFDSNIYIWESDPTTISWTRKTVAARTGDQAGGVHPCPAVVSPTALYIAWQENNPTPYPAQTATVQYSIYDGSSFTAKAVAWDCGTNQYPGAGISPAGDIDVAAPGLQFSGGTLRLLGYSEFDPSYDETELYLETVLFPPTSTQMNRFSTTSSYAGIVMP